MKKISKIIMFIMSTIVIAFLLPLPAIAGYSSWKQTSASDFASGTLVNIDITTVSGTFRVAKTSEVVEQEQTTYVLGAQSYQNHAQSFKPSIDCICTKIEIYIKKYGSPGNLTVCLKSDNNNSPGDTLASATISVGDVGTSYDWEIANITDTNLTANTRYWIFRPPVGDDNNYYKWAHSPNNPYANGNYWSSMEGNDTGYDFTFKVYEQHYESSSNLISQIGDLGIKPESWGKFEATDSSPGDSRITYNIRTSSYTGGLSDAPWWIVYKGQTILGPTLNRYVQWVTFLVPTNTETPVVDDVTINYSCKPTVPVLSSPTVGFTLHISTPTLTWNNSTDKDGDTLTYKILIDNNYDFLSPEVDISNIPEDPMSTSYTPPSLVDDTYYWRVCANDGSISGDWSATWSFIIDTTAPEILDVRFFLDKSTHNKKYFITGEKIEIKFNKEMSSSTMIPENIQIIDEDEENVLTESEIAYADLVTTITPSEPQMKYCTGYVLKVLRGVTDIDGNSLTKSESFSFTTLIPEGLEGPITVKHKAGKVTIKDPSTTFPGGSKGYYINLIETPSKYGEETARILRCYKVVKVDDNINEIDIGRLDRRVTISIYPRDTKDKKNLKLYFYNKEIDKWELVRGSECRNLDDDDYYVIGEVSITNIEYCVMAFAMAGLIEEYSNYPNPFKAGKEDTTIIYDLKENAKVTISLYDLLGQLVRRIEIAKGTPDGGTQGTNKVSWNGKNERGRVVANGGYYCVIEADTVTGENMRKARKIMVIK